MHPNDLPSLNYLHQQQYPPYARYQDQGYPPVTHDPPRFQSHTQGYSPTGPGAFPYTPPLASTFAPTPPESIKPILRRNQACLQCRRRKLRCDAVRPNCGTCTRSYHHAVRTSSHPNPRLECEYDDQGVGGQARKGSVSGEREKGKGKRQRVGDYPVSSRSRSVERREDHRPWQDHDPSNSRTFSGPLDPAISVPTGATEPIANSGYALPTLATGRWYEPNGGKASQVAAAQLAEIRTLKEHVAFLEAQLKAVDTGQPPTSTSQPPASASPLDMLSTAATNPAAYQPISPGPAKQARVDIAARCISKYPRRPGMGSAGGSVKSDGGRSSIHELMIGESWGSGAAAAAAAAAGTIKLDEQDDHRIDGDIGSGSRSRSRLPCAATSDAANESSATGEFMWDIMWSGWVKELPNPSLMHHIVEIFFTSVPTVSRAFHYETFKSRMSLPPTHADFPKPILLHAMCAASARYTAQVYTVNPEEQPWINASQHIDQPAFEEDFGVRHSLYAIRHVNSNLARGIDIYETCQALLLLANHYHIYARWVEGWTVIGMLGRLIVPLGLTGTRSQLLKPTGNVVEREERKLLAWMAVLYDIQSSTSGNWPGGIHFDEMDITMPTSLSCFDQALVHGIPETEQTIGSPDLFTRHPIQDGLQMHLKAMILLSKVNKFNRRLRMKAGGSDRPLMTDKETRELEELDSMIGAYILHFPAALRDPLMPLQARVNKPLDIDLFAAQILMHQSTMLLHEPHAVLTDPANVSTARLLSTARGTLRMLCLVTSTSLDLGLIVRAIFGLFTAGRVLCLFLKNAIRTGMQYAGSAETIRGEIELFHLAMSAQGKRFPLGVRHANMLETHLLECEDTTAEAHISVEEIVENGDGQHSAMHSIEDGKPWA